MCTSEQVAGGLGEGLWKTGRGLCSNLETYRVVWRKAKPVLDLKTGRLGIQSG